MPRPRSLLPKEHGAYAELGFPLATGLALTGPSLPSLALACAAIVLFLAHEPLAILLGLRGQRLKEQLWARARVRSAVLGGVGLAVGGLGLAGAGSKLWPSVLLPLASALLLVPLVLKGRQKTILGELLVVTVFATLVLPLAAASQADPARAGWAATVWWVSFFLGTLEVHAIKARHKGTRRSRWTLWGSPLATLTVIGLSVVGMLAIGGPVLRPALAVLPPAFGVFTLGLLRVHPRHLMRVGWTLVGANTLTLLLLLFGPAG